MPHKLHIGTMLFLVELAFILFMSIMIVLSLPIIKRLRHEAIFIEAMDLSRDIFKRWFWFVK